MYPQQLLLIPGTGISAGFRSLVWMTKNFYHVMVMQLLRGININPLSDSKCRAISYARMWEVPVHSFAQA